MLRSYKVAQLHFFPLLVLYDGMSFLRFSFCRWNIIFPARQKETHQQSPPPTDFPLKGPQAKGEAFLRNFEGNNNFSYYCCFIKTCLESVESICGQACLQDLF